MRSSRNLQGALSRHFALVKPNYIQRPLFPQLAQYIRTNMPKRKFRQVATDSIVAINVSEESTISSISIPQHRRKVPITEDETVGSAISRNAFAKPNTDGDTLKNTLSDTDSPLSDLPEIENNIGRPSKSKRSKNVEKTITKNSSVEATKLDLKSSNGIIPPENLPSEDAESDVDEEFDEAKIQEALSRSPPVNSSYLPLPWKGRLGYACLNTYLRASTPPVFSSRTCRIASILEHRHPLKDPSQPEHATKNRPDRDMPADIRRGQEYVEGLGIANAKDIIKMIRWNDKYGIKFMRLSSEVFPFASHDIYGYKLAPFAADVLQKAGKVIAELGHRVTTHPGQFTQLGSPRKQVIDAAIRDLQYHDEMLSLLKLPPQQNRDAVMILHMGGVFGSKPDTLTRFREAYNKLPQSVQNRLVLENDDVCWTVHDLLPICQELNIPLVLDYHHHNILFDSDKIREGTEDIGKLYDEIAETWRRKNITQKMHYSEPTPAAITARQRRKHSPRVATLPPCANTMDLMIEAKDKEQAVFELMRIFKLPGHDLFNNIAPHVRSDENKVARKVKKTAPKKKAKDGDAEEAAEGEIEAQPPTPVPGDEVGMGGDERRVYWPPGMEHWLRPKKRIVKKDEQTTTLVKSKGKKSIPDTVENFADTSAAGEPKKPSDRIKPVKRKGKNFFVTPPISDEQEVNNTNELDLNDNQKQSITDAVVSSALSKSKAQRKSSRRSSAKVSYV